MNYVVFDTETTGLTRRQTPRNEPCSVLRVGSEVIQIGGLVLNESMVPTRAFCFYCDCLAPCSPEEAYQTHGISMSEVRKYASDMFPGEILHNFLPEFLADDVVFIGYNVGFDISMLSQSTLDFTDKFVDIPTVDMFMPTRGRHSLDVMSYFPKRLKLTQHTKSLGEKRKAFYEEYGGKLTIETNALPLLEEQMSHAHNALFDSIETYLLFMDKVWKQKVFGGK